MICGTRPSLSAALGAEVLVHPADVANIKSAEGTVLERLA